MIPTTVELIRLWIVARVISWNIVKNWNVASGIASSTLIIYKEQLEKGNEISSPTGYIATISRRRSVSYIKHLATMSGGSLEGVLEMVDSQNHFQETEQFLTQFQEPLAQTFHEDAFKKLEALTATKRDVLYFTLKGHKSSLIAEAVEELSACNVMQLKHRFIENWKTFVTPFLNHFTQEQLKEMLMDVLLAFMAIVENREPPKRSTLVS